MPEKIASWDEVLDRMLALALAERDRRSFSGAGPRERHPVAALAR